MKGAIEKIIEKLEEQIRVEDSIANGATEGHAITHKYTANCMKVIEEFIKHTAAEYNNGWIPCSERLPKKDGFYLATLDGEIVGENEPFTGLAELENGKWLDDEDDYQCILAWQQLPAPYQQKGE